MSNEDKMREEFETTLNGIYALWSVDHYVDPLIEARWNTWKACAAIKDAEIARQMDIQAEWAALARKQEEEIAVRDLMIKELRGLLLQLSYNEFGAERFPSEESVEQALANSEHHNSRALEKMLLVARIAEAELSYRSNGKTNFNRIVDMSAKLAELNKE